MKTEIVRSLKQHEELIESGIKGFLDVGRSLIAIRDGKLYRDKYDTFEAYCKERWQFTDRRARQYIEAVEVVENISENGTIVPVKTNNSGGKAQNVLPSNEAQARAVAQASDDPKEQSHVWKAAVAAAPKDEDGLPQVTASIVRRVAGQVLEPREPGEDETEQGHATESEIVTEQDQFGEVSANLATVFASVSEFKGLQKKIGSAQNDAEELQRSDAGAALPIQEIINAFKTIKQGVKFAIPYCECPKCRRSKKACETCDGLRWITEATFKRCRTEDDEKWLKGDRS